MGCASPAPIKGPDVRCRSVRSRGARRNGKYTCEQSIGARVVGYDTMTTTYQITA